MKAVANIEPTRYSISLLDDAGQKLYTWHTRLIQDCDGVESYKIVRNPGAAVAAVAIALSLGWFINRPADVSAAEVKADTADVHIVQTGENLWDICRPLADARGMDIREVIYLISVNNGINQDASLKPGQRITLRF